jgi:hypothetical protein
MRLANLSGRRMHVFYVYENWRAGPHKLVIHIGSCGDCNDGHGKAGATNPAYCRWHGPFPNVPTP